MQNNGDINIENIFDIFARLFDSLVEQHKAFFSFLYEIQLDHLIYLWRFPRRFLVFVVPVVAGFF